MIDIKLLREKSDFFQKSAKDKGIDIDVHHILEIDKKRNELQKKVQNLQEERNAQVKEIKGKPSKEQIAKGKLLREKLEKEQHALDAVQHELHEWLLKIPNPARPDVKVGKDETENEVIKKFKEPTKFSLPARSGLSSGSKTGRHGFTPKDHLEIGEALDIIDVKRAAKVSGARFGYLKNEAVLLEFALVQFALEILIKEGFTPVVPPVLIRKNITEGLGYWQGGGKEDYYLINEPENEDGVFYLVGTAEHSIVPMHMDETFDKNHFPKRYVGFSTAFRREAGTYGKDTKGIFRVHQFDKVEMISFVAEGKDDKEQEYMLHLEEKFFQMLEIPHQIVKMCTGDLGFPAARKYDIEAWMPSQQKYREVTSVSTCTDFQARRLNIKYKEGNEKKYTHILNGTAFAIGRTIIAILENYQQEDGSVIIPEVLRKYIGKDKIERKNNDKKEE